MARYVGLLAYPYLFGLIYFGCVESPWWTPFAAAIGGFALLLMLPGKAEQLFSRVLYGYHSERVGAVAATFRRPFAIGRAVIVNYLLQVATAAIPFGIGRGVGIFI